MMPLLYFLAVILVAQLSVFFHELGHAVVARRMGFRVTSFGVGFAKPVLVLDWGGTKVFFCRARCQGGITFMLWPGIYHEPRALAWALAGGGMANAVVALASLMLAWLLPLPSWPFLLLTAVNGTMAVYTFFPFTFQVGAATLRSDGAVIRQVLRQGAPEQPHPARIETVTALRPLWEGIGDNAGLVAHLLTAAVAWAELDDAENARRLTADAAAVPLPEIPFLRAFRQAVAGLVAALVGDHAQAAADLDAAERQVAALQHPGGALMVTWARADLLTLRGEPAEALALLAPLVEHPIIGRARALQDSLRLSRLRAVVALGDRPAAEQLLAEHLARPAATRLAARDLHAYQAVAALYAVQEDWPAAEGAYDGALTALRQLYSGFSDEANARRLLECQAELIAAARQCAERLGKGDWEQRMAALFPPPAELKRVQQADHEGRNRRRHRLGFALSAVNLVLGVAILFALALAPDPSYRRDELLLTLLASLLLFPLFTLVYSLALWVSARWVPGARRTGEGWTLLLAITPWLAWLLVAAFPTRQRDLPGALRGGPRRLRPAAPDFD